MIIYLNVTPSYSKSRRLADILFSEDPVLMHFTCITIPLWEDLECLVRKSIVLTSAIRTDHIQLVPIYDVISHQTIAAAHLLLLRTSEKLRKYAMFMECCINLVIIRGNIVMKYNRRKYILTLLI